jgi:hypothetical protein
VIIGGLLAISTMTDYPNGLASFLQRVVRPFDPRERLAWSSADDGGSPTAAMAESDEHDQDLYDHAAGVTVAALGGTRG